MNKCKSLKKYARPAKIKPQACPVHILLFLGPAFIFD